MARPAGPRLGVRCRYVTQLRDACGTRRSTRAAKCARSGMRRPFANVAARARARCGDARRCPVCRGRGTARAAVLGEPRRPVGHQLPGMLGAGPATRPASSAAARWSSSCGASSSGGLMTPAMWPDAPSTNVDVAAQQLDRPVRRAPRHDVVLARGVDVGRQRDAREVDRSPHMVSAPGSRSFSRGTCCAGTTSTSGPAGWPSRCSSRAGRTPAASRPSGSCRRRSSRPDRWGAGCEGVASSLPRTRPPGEQRRLARRERTRRDVDADVARVGEIEHGREQRELATLRLAPRGEHGERGGEQRAADAEAQRVDRSCSPVISRATSIAASTPLLDVVVPGERARARPECCAR